MKRVLFGVVALAVTVCLVTVAGADQRNTGCGLGSMAFQGQDGLISQVFAATTNGTFGNQTFGITTGTSNCEQFKSFTMNDKVNSFVADNMDNLAKDIAKGEGEYLDTMAGLMAMAPTERPQFYAALQQNFSRIYSSPAVSPADVLAAIDGVASSM